MKLHTGSVRSFSLKPRFVSVLISSGQLFMVAASFCLFASLTNGLQLRNLRKITQRKPRYVIPKSEAEIELHSQHKTNPFRMLRYNKFWMQSNCIVHTEIRGELYFLGDYITPTSNVLTNSVLAISECDRVGFCPL